VNNIFSGCVEDCSWVKKYQNSVEIVLNECKEPKELDVALRNLFSDMRMKYQSEHCQMFKEPKLSNNEPKKWTFKPTSGISPLSKIFNRLLA